METIKLQYNDLTIKKQDITSHVNSLINIIEQIDKECKTLDGIWEGNLSNKFQETSKRLIECSNKVTNNLRITNEFKNIVNNEFLRTEAENSSTYNIG